MLASEIICSSYLQLLSLATIFQSAAAYPYFDPRVQENDWREMMLLSQPPPRPQYETSFGYPDYGDYGESRPAYSEMDILREQLARSEPPFNKRLPAYESNIPVWEAAPAPALPGTWYDREIPAQNQIQETDNVQELTEALMEALAQQIEQNRLAEAMMSAVSYDAPADQVDPVVEELRDAAVKKSILPSTTSTDSPKTATSTITSIAVPPRPTTEAQKRFPAKKDGQKEVPLLRPPSKGRNFPSRSFNTKIPTVGNDNQQKVKKQMRFPRYDVRHPIEKFVSTEDDLTQELDSLKKKSH